MALNAARSTARRAGNQSALPVALATIIFQGAMVAMKTGFSRPAASDPAQVVIGVAERTADNSTGANGDKSVRVDRGTFCFDISGADPVTIADVGASVYAVDDHTIARTDGGAARPIAGKLVDVDSAGAWVRFG